MKRKTARGQRSPANIGNGGKNFRASHRPKQTCENGTGISVPTGWNGKSGITWEGRPFVPYNFRSNRAFHVHLNRLNQKSLTWGDFSRPVSPRRESIFLYVDGTLHNESTKLKGSKGNILRCQCYAYDNLVPRFFLPQSHITHLTVF